MSIKLGVKDNIAVFDQANDIIFLHDARTGAIINLNEKAYRFYGYTLDEIRKQKKLDIYAGEPPYSENEIMRYLRKAADGEPQLFEWKTTTKSGQTVWVEISLNRIDLQNRETVLAIIREIPGGKPSQNTPLHSSEHSLILKGVTIAIVNSADANDIMIAVANRASKLLGTKHGFIYLVNARQGTLDLAACTSSICNFLLPELKPGENLPGRVWQTGKADIIQNTLIWDERMQSIPSDVTAITCTPMKSGDKITGVIGLCYMDGNQLPTEEQMDLLNYFAELAANTLKKSQKLSPDQPKDGSQTTESPIKKTADWYETLFNNINDCVHLASITEFNFPGQFIEVNNTVCNKLGYSREELFSLTPADIIPLEHRGDIQYQMEMLLSQQQFMFETVYITKAGESLPVEINSLLLPIEGIPCILSVVRDINERKRVTKETSLLERLNLVGSMAAGIGQEIRNPLTTVRGFLQMLIGKDEYSDYNNHLDLMLQEIDRASAIITDFISLAKPKPADSRRGNLNTIIGILLPLLEAGAILYHKTIKTELGEIADIPLDDKDIRQLILNLARNGLDAMPPRGMLTIKTYQREKEIILSIQDQGKGIPPDVIDKVGTPFFTTKEYGVGLGLAVCYSIAARHDASLTFDSSPTGTTFNVSFKIR